jgi:hypothetical protein
MKAEWSEFLPESRGDAIRKGAQKAIKRRKKLSLPAYTVEFPKHVPIEQQKERKKIYNRAYKEAHRKKLNEYKRKWARKNRKLKAN